jgi:SecD/SecF fusion protein
MDSSFLNDLLLNSLPLAQNAVEAADGVQQGISWQQYLAIVVALAVLILPFVAGKFLAKLLKMPTHATRFGFVLLAVTASTVVLVTVFRTKGELPRGVDLAGGTILVYEIDPGKISGNENDPEQRIVSEDLIEPLTRRINPSGTQEIVLRPYGDSQIEIIVPAVDENEVNRIKKKIEEAGILRFAILANQSDHQRHIELALAQSESNRKGERTSPFVEDVDGSIIGRWAVVDRENPKNEGDIAPLRVNVSDAILRNPATGEIIQDGQNIQLPVSLRGENAEFKIAAWADAEKMKGIETLMIVDPLLDIRGEDLAFAASTFDQNGSPAVAFNLTDAGSGKFFALTTNNAPIGTRQRQLGIVLDDNLLSAPNILQPIRKEGRITGRFTREEVEDLVSILKAGQLPAALTKQPIAENQIDPTLGQDTIDKGQNAIMWSLIAVLIFIVFYYMFAGVIACIALLLNLAMILATMVLINQPLTLPGLAGLVLTVGMSVDANVLIFERIREELKKGAANRMAIRNGFAKATVTIVDANLTTLITAIVLYAIGTDQIRGFAVTLILGILFSMFTAIYMSRAFFDVAERHGFLSLNMFDFVTAIRRALSGEGTLDFISKGKITIAMSSLFVLVGIGALYSRGQSILGIDFAGGSSVQFRLDNPTSSDRVREIVGVVMETQKMEDGTSVPFTVNGVNIKGIPDETVYKVDCGLEKVDELKAAVSKAFAESADAGLVTYRVEVTPAGSAAINRAGNGVMLTAARAQDDAAAPAVTAEEGVDAEAQANSDSATAAVTDDRDVTTARVIEFGIEDEDENDKGAAVNAATLIEMLVESAGATNVSLSERLFVVSPIGNETEDWEEESMLTFPKWKVELPLDAAAADQVMNAVKQRMDNDPVWISSSSVGGRVKSDMIGRALGALFASLICIIAYIWFRFQRVIYGLAAVAALLHDVLITLGFIAISAWLVGAPGFLMIEPFKISLTVVAALLTIIGYSLNDTIVVFDRIRETKGKAPRLTGEMVNTSINQTLSRTLLTSMTTLLVVLVLYFFGGEGIHAFAFALVVGVIAGTYSSIFIASPILLWLLDRQQPQTRTS